MATLRASAEHLPPAWPVVSGFSPQRSRDSSKKSSARFISCSSLLLSSDGTERNNKGAKLKVSFSIRRADKAADSQFTEADLNIICWETRVSQCALSRVNRLSTSVSLTSLSFLSQAANWTSRPSLCHPLQAWWPEKQPTCSAFGVWILSPSSSLSTSHPAFL